VALVIFDVSEERVASLFRMEIFSELGTALAVTDCNTLQRNTNCMRKDSIGVGYMGDGWRRPVWAVYKPV
jgi:hypothetical protein